MAGSRPEIPLYPIDNLRGITRHYILDGLQARNIDFTRLHQQYTDSLLGGRLQTVATEIGMSITNTYRDSLAEEVLRYGPDAVKNIFGDIQPRLDRILQGVEFRTYHSFPRGFSYNLEGAQEVKIVKKDEQEVEERGSMADLSDIELADIFRGKFAVEMTVGWIRTALGDTIKDIARYENRNIAEVVAELEPVVSRRKNEMEHLDTLSMPAGYDSLQAGVHRNGDKHSYKRSEVGNRFPVEVIGDLHETMRRLDYTWSIPEQKFAFSPRKQMPQEDSVPVING